MTKNLVEVHGLRAWFPVQTNFFQTIATKQRDFVRAVDGVDFNIRREARGEGLFGRAL